MIQLFEVGLSNFRVHRTSDKTSRKTGSYTAGNDTCQYCTDDSGILVILNITFLYFFPKSYDIMISLIG